MELGDVGGWGFWFRLSGGWISMGEVDVWGEVERGGM